MNDRIRLAESMGWNRCPDQDGAVIDLWSYPDAAKPWYRMDELPDPFTDANDDYAALEWANENLDHDAYFSALTEVVGSYCYLHEYRIGYFARAALKVIDRDGFCGLAGKP